MVADVRAGLLLLRDPGGQSYVPAAVWPNSRQDVTHLTGAAERALSERRAAVVGLKSTELQSVATGTVHVAYPVESDGEVMGAVVMDLRTRPEAELQSVLRQLLWGAGWLVALIRKHRISGDQHLLQRASVALDLIQTAQEHSTLDEAAIAVVNELATLSKADRVSLGIAQHGKLKLRAISRTAWFDRKSQLVETLENAMEEALDQEASIAYPPIPAARGKVSVAHRDLASRAGASTVVTVLIMSAGQPVGALTLERNEGAAFDADSITVCEAAGELLGPAFDAMLDRERWLSGRLAETIRAWSRKLIGPRRPALKLGVLLALIAAVILSFADGEFRVSARTVVEGEIQRAAVAPFDGYIAQAFARAGDTVRQGTVLAVLDDRELKLERTRWESEREQAARKYHEALAKQDRASSRILAAQREQADAQLALAEEKLLRAQLIAPFDAVVVAGDLSQMLGAPIEKGKVLFELAPLDRYRVVLKVDERDISYLAAGQHGELGLTGITGGTLPFTVKTVTSVSTPQEGRNFFRVEAQLADTSTRLRPGMEGVGKVAIGERRLIWIWTRNFVNWLRISLWSWLP
jgi:multidrug resistance efflux pump